MSPSSHINLTQVASEEAILASAIIPIGTLGTLLTLLIFAAIVKAYFDDDVVTIWKSRTIFEGFSLLSSILGFVFGIYGVVFVLQRVNLEADTMDLPTKEVLVALFVWHRFLLMGSDLFPSMDRCMAVLYPLKYYARASPKLAFGNSNLCAFDAGVILAQVHVYINMVPLV